MIVARLSHRRDQTWAGAKNSDAVSGALPGRVPYQPDPFASAVRNHLCSADQKDPAQTRLAIPGLHATTGTAAEVPPSGRPQRVVATQ
jgi:hypothetical protein